MPSLPGFITRYFKDEPKPPPISTSTAIFLLVIYTIIYVVPFYLSSKTRPSSTLSRDAPSVIRARIASVSLTSVVCSAITFVILTSQDRATTAEAFHALGYWPIGLAEAGKSLLLTAILFAGPLYEYLIVDEEWRDWLALRPLSALFTEWTTWRNIVAGPFTEEVLFRSAAVPLMLAAQTSVTTTIFLSPLVFGLSHLHHFYEFRVTLPNVPTSFLLVRSIMQLGFTTLFGAYATFLFLRSGSLLAIFVVHAFCNCMGLPRVWGRVLPEIVVDERGNSSRPSVLWTVIYYIVLVAGAVGWYKNLGSLTESSNALIAIKI
ncbi:uncharacterized protein GGS22DRAFT_31247 [Annulohypoxylon maeteangense]|uniref:uncharacterized protein n=1 Tax=Annulohypoxylon maeteangense TaxID=1927788 RepID=UPI002007C24F|nr:uncharacterized protein GGS22DRAFT_31247 [Annulohypoxylon maeteangense]KAI0883475.1 hypothetical protein GGS22DRAFT_31247 [Annulohypoxylon maeteangense]